MLQLIHLFQEFNWEVIFASSAQPTAYSDPLQDRQIECIPIKLNHSSFQTTLNNIQPDVVLFDRFMTEEQFGWRVDESIPDALKILDTEDLHGLRSGRQSAVKEGRVFRESDLLNPQSYREIASLLRCDVSLIISEYELNLLESFFKVPSYLLYYLPLFVAKDRLGPSLIPFNQRRHLVTIGNFLHPPNRDAVHQLRKVYWPGIRSEIPDAELHIYGAYANTNDIMLNNPDEGFYMKGRAEEAISTLERYRVLLAPLRFGAGLKGKVLDSMQAGTPVGTTHIGAEGISGTHPFLGFVEDDRNTFIAQAIRLYKDETQWKQAQTNGYTILRDRFNSDIHKKAFMDGIEALLSNRELHRKKNFTGAMLKHHSLASTKFMGRWIEEKNRTS